MPISVVNLVQTKITTIRVPSYKLEYCQVTKLGFAQFNKIQYNVANRLQLDGSLCH